MFTVGCWPCSPATGFALPASSNRLLLLPVFGDVHNFVLEDEEVGAVLTGEPDYILVVILDPPANHFAIGQFQAYRFLLFTERLQVRGLLEGLVRRRSAFLAKVGISRLQRHTGILHAKEVSQRNGQQTDS